MAFLVVPVLNGIRGICRQAQGCFEAIADGMRSRRPRKAGAGSWLDGPRSGDRLVNQSTIDDDPDPP